MGMISSLARLKIPLGMAAVGGGAGYALGDPEDRLGGAMTGAITGGGMGMLGAPVLAALGKAGAHLIPTPARLANSATQAGINLATPQGVAAFRKQILGHLSGTTFPKGPVAQLIAAAKLAQPKGTHQQIADHVLALAAGARDKVIEGVGDTAGMVGSGLSKGAGAVRRKAVQGARDTLGEVGLVGGDVVDAAAGGVNKIGGGVRSVLGKNADLLVGGAALGGGGYMMMQDHQNKSMEQQARYNMLRELGLPANAAGLDMLRQKHGVQHPKPDMAWGDPGFRNEDMMLLAEELNARQAAAAKPGKKPKR